MCKIRIEKAKEFFTKDKAADQMMQEFASSEKFQKMIDEQYDQLTAGFVAIQGKVPESLEKIAQETLDTMEITKEIYNNMILEDFKIVVYQLYIEEQNPDPLKSSSSQVSCNIIKGVIESERAERILKEITAAFKKSVLEKYFRAIYISYVPQGMTPSDAAMIRKHYNGGIIVPITALPLELIGGLGEIKELIDLLKLLGLL
jgi:hypothetical protein